MKQVGIRKGETKTCESVGVKRGEDGVEERVEGKVIRKMEERVEGKVEGRKEGREGEVLDQVHHDFLTVIRNSKHQGISEADIRNIWGTS